MPTTVAGIIVRGRVVPAPGLQCVLPDTDGLWFTPENTRVRARAKPADLLVFHDTAGEGSGPRIYRTLLAKRLSVHFAIDRAGLVWQFCDPALVSCAHVGRGYNSRSVGVEIANAVFSPGIRPGIWANISRYYLTGRERLLGRPVVHETYRGRGRRVLGHLEPQRAAVAALARALLACFPTIPACLPRLEPGGKVHGRRVPADYAGIAAHLHLTDSHVDPALDAFDHLAWKVD